MKKLFAFTLTEVLITLSIVGVVSAMTLPTLVTKHQKKVLVAQFQKTYSVLSQAFESMMDEENVVRFEETQFYKNCFNGDSTAQCRAVVNNYIKRAKTDDVDSAIEYNVLSCSTTDDPHSSSSDGHRYSGNCTKSDTTNSSYTRGIVVSLPDGADLYVRSYNSGAGFFTIDVNGAQKPNTFGRDVFILSVDNQGAIHPHGLYTEGNGGASQIIDDGWEMNY